MTDQCDLDMCDTGIKFLGSPIGAYRVVSTCQVCPTRGRPPALVCICILLTTERAIPFAYMFVCWLVPSLGLSMMRCPEPISLQSTMYFQDKIQHHINYRLQASSPAKLRF
ncbi:hypothetical protein B5807_02589 [Epicoccum nigrum]|uniref:Uncharacterized protein n=1 Tax=Epicoccum nigrum TaxID=105696 RepID=A0A1Y2M8A9_EPING|nr:hypothetical protein B5807_02589 [Epicoccum nigrum]